MRPGGSHIAILLAMFFSNVFAPTPSARGAIPNSGHVCANVDELDTYESDAVSCDSIIVDLVRANEKKKS